MDIRIDIDERQWFHRLQRAGREQHADAVKRMTRAQLRHYVTYLRELQRLSIEEYDALFGRQADCRNRETVECQMMDRP